MSTNITVNGQPLDEYVGKEVGKEIGEVRASDEHLKVRMPLATKNRNNTSGTRTKSGVVVYQKGQRETHILICGNIFNWADKAPFERSGSSVLGALEYDEKTDEVKCHHCGSWCASIDKHIVAQRIRGSFPHPTVREYRIRHGFKLSSPLNVPRVTAARRAAAVKRGLGTTFIGKEPPRLKARPSFAERRAIGISAHSENFNLVAGCRAQRIGEIKHLSSSLGRVPTAKELVAYKNSNGTHTLNPIVLQRLFGVSLRKIIIQCCLLPRERGKWTSAKAQSAHGKRTIAAAIAERHK